MDTGPSGDTGHTGNDGSSTSDRISRYITWTALGENLAYSNIVNGEDVILQFIIDDGVSSRGHRTNIYNSTFTHTGVSCGCHSAFTEMCCIAYATRAVELSSDTADVAPQLSKCSAYTASTSGDTSGSFDLTDVPDLSSYLTSVGPGSTTTTDSSDDSCLGQDDDGACAGVVIAIIVAIVVVVAIGGVVAVVIVKS